MTLPRKKLCGSSTSLYVPSVGSEIGSRKSPELSNEPDVSSLPFGFRSWKSVSATLEAMSKLTSCPALPVKRIFAFWPGIVNGTVSGVPSTATSWTMSDGTV